MRTGEEDWISKTLAGWPPDQLTPCLNIGCGHLGPWKDQGFFLDFKRRGVTIIHFDRTAFPGVDIAGDLFNPACQQRLKALAPRSALLTNVLEHLPKEVLSLVPAIVHDVLADGAILIVTVPRSFPYHADPIDTLYRPTPAELAQLFEPAGFDVVASEVIRFDSFLADLRSGGAKNWWHWIFRLLKPFRRWHKWLNAAHSALWLFRPYEESLIVLRRRPAADHGIGTGRAI
jgi:hypothetical protein